MSIVNDRYMKILKNRKGTKLEWVLTLINAIFLILFTFLLQYTDFIRFDEIGFFRAFAIVKHNILALDKKPALDSITFLDVSKDLEIVGDTSIYTYGDVVVTNRKKLAEFFSILNKHPEEYKYVICDMSFDYPSPNDSILKAQIEIAKKVIVASTIKNNRIVGQLFNVPNGSVSYTLNKGKFVKLDIFDHGTIKTLPVKLVENLTKDTFTCKYGLVFKNQKLTFNTIIPELYYRPHDLVRDTNTNPTKLNRKANLFYLGEILADTTEFFKTYLRGKYIIVGNFETDMHSTYLGKFPGSLILFDTFLTLREQSKPISWVWIFILFMTFFLISYFIFIHPEKSFEEFPKKVKISFLRNFLKKYFSYVGILICLNVISYIYFGVFISLLYVASYLTLLKIFIEKRKHFIKSRNFVTFVKEEIS